MTKIILDTDKWFRKWVPGETQVYNINTLNISDVINIELYSVGWLNNSLVDTAQVHSDQQLKITSKHDLLSTIILTESNNLVSLNWSLPTSSLLEAGIYQLVITTVDSSLKCPKFKLLAPCIFCSDEVRSKAIYKDSEIMIIKDIHPASDVAHYLSIPINHIQNCHELKTTDLDLLEKLYQVGNEQLNQINFEGERSIGFHLPPFNFVNHLHLHFIALPVNSNLASLLFNESLSFLFLSYENFKKKLLANST